MLRLIAIISMIIDHAAVLFIQHGIINLLPPGSESLEMWSAIYADMRTIGRMAFPIFAVLLVQGYKHTKSFRNYALRLFLLALVSEIPFDWVIQGHWGVDLTYQNTVYTLLTALLTIKAADTLNRYFTKRRMKLGTGSLPPAEYMLIWALAAIAGCLAANFIQSDYEWEGVALIIILYLCRDSKMTQCILGAIWSMTAIMGLRFPYVWGYAAAFIIIYFLRDKPPLYTGSDRRVKAALRAAEYLSYPVHFLVLWCVYCAVFQV